MTTPKATFAGLALIAALYAGFTLGLTAPAWAGFDEGKAAYQRGDYLTTTTPRDAIQARLTGASTAKENLARGRGEVWSRIVRS